MRIALTIVILLLGIKVGSGSVRLSPERQVGRKKGNDPTPDRRHVTVG